MADITALITENIGDIGRVAAIVVIGAVFYLLTRRGIGLLVKGGLAEPVARVLRIFLRWTLVTIVGLIVLQELNILHNVWSALVATMAMVAVGFIAVWSILSNILSTLLILLYRPFKIGDDIEIPSESLSGTVEDLNLMFTTLKAEDGQLIQIPNNLFFQKPIRRRQGDARIDLFEQLRKRTH